MFRFHPTACLAAAGSLYGTTTIIYPIKTNVIKLIILHLLVSYFHPLLYTIKCPLTNGFSSGYSYLHMIINTYY